MISDIGQLFLVSIGHFCVFFVKNVENRKLRSGSAIQENVAGGGAQVRAQVQVLYFGFEILGKFP